MTGLMMTFARTSRSLVTSFTRSSPAAARAIHTSNVARDEDESIETLDNRALEFYRSHPASHYQIPLDKINFFVGEHFVTKQPFPMMKFEDAPGDQKLNAVHSVTPFSKGVFCWFGEKGNIGKPSKFTKSKDGIISDPLEAKQEINLYSDPLRTDAQPNEPLLSYFEWMEGLRTKYVEHLAHNLEHYKTLEKKFGFLVASDPDRSTVFQMIDNLTTHPVKHAKDEYGEELPDSAFLRLEQKIYFKQDPNKKFMIRCELDEEMKQEGFVRRHIPLYDRYGVEIPLQEASINPGDIITVESNLTCQLYDVGGNVGAGIRRNIKSVTRLRASESSMDSVAQTSPFKL